MLHALPEAAGEGRAVRGNPISHIFEVASELEVGAERRLKNTTTTTALLIQTFYIYGQ